MKIYDIPLGWAIAPFKDSSDVCADCFFSGDEIPCRSFECCCGDRKDGHSVIFKLIPLTEEAK